MQEKTKNPTKKNQETYENIQDACEDIQYTPEGNQEKVLIFKINQ